MKVLNVFEAHLNDRLTDIFNFVMRYEEASLKSIAGTPATISEAHILKSIGGKKEAATVSEIAADLKISAPSATIAVKKLLAKGLVTKASSEEDARRNDISLTDSGRRIYRAHDLFHRQMVRNISRNFSDAEKEALLSAVEKLGNFFRERIDSL